ncbi:MAG: zinc ribbon domain-containing protein, partial [Anaerolineae bacterium]|nr:zinc ribbon domain-containing protein [Anaerolineae bacterium]
MARCSNCGADLVNTAQYCHQCGLPVASTSGEQTDKTKTKALIDDQDGQTSILADEAYSAEDGSTTLLPDSDDGDGATVAITESQATTDSPH